MERVFKGNKIQFVFYGAIAFLSFWAIDKSTLLLFEKTDTVYSYLIKNLNIYTNSILYYSFIYLAILCLCIITRKQLPGREQVFLSSIFSVCTVVGMSYDLSASAIYISGSIGQFFIAIIRVFGCFFFYLEVFLLVNYVRQKCKEHLTRRRDGNSVLYFVLEKHPFCLCFFILFLSTFPVVIAFFPGLLEPDSFASIHFFAENSYYANWPIIMSKIMGAFYVFGKEVLHNDNAGMFIYCFIQVIIQSLLLAYSFVIFKKMRLPIIIRLIILIFYVLFPIYSLWGYTMAKNTGYYLSIMCFSLATCDILFSEKVRIKSYILIVVGTVGVLISRNQGALIIIPSLVIISFIACFSNNERIKRFRKVSIICLAISIAYTCAYNAYIQYSPNIQPGTVKEYLSISLQITARNIRDNKQNFTEEEENVLKDLFVGVNDLSEVGVAYRPNIVDPVKNLVGTYPDRDLLTNYAKVFLKQLVKYPDTSISAVLSLSSGYLCPCTESYGGTGSFSILEIEDDYVKASFVNELSPFRELIKLYCMLIKNAPIIGLLYYPGMSVYILMICLTYMFRKKRYLFLLFPSVFLLFVVFSPANAFFSYILPLLILAPINLSIVYTCLNSDFYKE